MFSPTLYVSSQSFALASICQLLSHQRKQEVSVEVPRLSYITNKKYVAHLAYIEL